MAIESRDTYKRSFIVLARGPEKDRVICGNDDITDEVKCDLSATAEDAVKIAPLFPVDPATKRLLSLVVDRDVRFADRASRLDNAHHLSCATRRNSDLVEKLRNVGYTNFGRSVLKPNLTILAHNDVVEIRVSTGHFFAGKDDHYRFLHDLFSLITRSGVERLPATLAPEGFPSVAHQVRALRTRTTPAYYVAGHHWREVMAALQLKEGTFWRWGKQIKEFVGFELKKAKLYPPGRYSV